MKSTRHGDRFRLSVFIVSILGFGHVSATVVIHDRKESSP